MHGRNLDAEKVKQVTVTMGARKKKKMTQITKAASKKKKKRKEMQATSPTLENW